MGNVKTCSDHKTLQYFCWKLKILEMDPSKALGLL